MLQALFNVERIHGGNVLSDVKQSLKVNRRSVEGDTRECSAITVAINDSKKFRSYDISFPNPKMKFSMTTSRSSLMNP